MVYSGIIEKDLVSNIIDTHEKPLNKYIVEFEIQSEESSENKTIFSIVKYKNKYNSREILGNFYFYPNIKNSLEDFFSEIALLIGNKKFCIGKEVLTKILDTTNGNVFFENLLKYLDYFDKLED